MESLLRMLPALIRQAEDSPEAREYAVFTAWDIAAGEGVRRFAAPVRLYGRRLLVVTASELWKSEIERLSDQLIFRMNGLLGDPVVSQVVFRVDPAGVSAARPHVTAPAAPELPVAADAGIEDSAAAISDPALRTTFVRAASRCLARQKSRG